MLEDAIRHSVFAKGFRVTEVENPALAVTASAEPRP
jgi:hypothetical protein